MSKLALEIAKKEAFLERPGLSAEDRKKVQASIAKKLRQQAEQS